MTCNVFSAQWVSRMNHKTLLKHVDWLMERCTWPARHVVLLLLLLLLVVVTWHASTCQSRDRAQRAVWVGTLRPQLAMVIVVAWLAHSLRAANVCFSFSVLHFVSTFWRERERPFYCWVDFFKFSVTYCFVEIILICCVFVRVFCLNFCLIVSVLKMLCLDYCVFMETVNKLICHSRLFKLCLKIHGLRVLASVCVRSFFLSTRLCKCFLLLCLYKTRSVQ